MSSIEKRILIAQSITASQTSYGNAQNVAWQLTNEEQEAYTISNFEIEFMCQSSNALIKSQQYSDSQRVTDCGDYQGSCQPHTATRYQIDSWAWKDKTSGRIIEKFAKYTANNINYTYSNVYIVITLEQNEVVQPSSVSVNTVAVGATQAATISNESAIASHIVKWSYAGETAGGTSTAIEQTQTLDETTRTTSWAVPEGKVAEIYYANTNTQTVQGKLYLTTLQNGEPVTGGQEQQNNIYLTIPNTLKPSVTGATITVESHDTSINYLQNHSTIGVTPSFSTQYHATISKIRISTPDFSQEVSASIYKFIVPLTVSGTYVIKLTAIDSRGFISDEYSTSIDVVECSGPTFTLIDADRCQQNGILDDEAQYVKLQCTATATIGSGTTTMTYDITAYDSSNPSGTPLYQLQDVPAQDLPAVTTIILGDNNFTFDPEKQYIIQITANATASIGGTPITQSSTAQTFVSTSTYTIYRMPGGKGVAFGKVAEQNGVEIAPTWPLYTHGKEIMELIVNVAHPLGSTLSTLDSLFDPRKEWPWTYWSQLRTETSSSPSYTTYVWVRIQ